MIRLRDKMREDLELRGSSAATIEAYVRCARSFVEHFHRPPAKLGAAEVRSYLLHLLHERRAAPGTINVYAAAIGFLYRVTLKRPEVVAEVVHMKRPMRLPRFLSGPEVARLLAALPTARLQAMAMLAYGAGLRVSEIVRLETTDIDAKRMVIHVREAKRGRERYVMLSPRLLRTLRAYWKAAKRSGPRLFAEAPTPFLALTIGLISRPALFPASLTPPFRSRLPRAPLPRGLHGRGGYPVRARRHAATGSA